MGLKRACGQFLFRAGFNYARMFYFETDLRKREFEKPPTEIDVVVRQAPESEVLGRVEELGTFGGRRAQEQVERGDRCYFAESDGKLAGYTWVSTCGVYGWGHLLSPLADRGVYSTLSFVFPEFRGHRLFRVMLCHVFPELQAEGFQFACNIVARANGASVRTREQMEAVGKPITVMSLPGTGPIIFGLPIGTGELVGINSDR